MFELPSPQGSRFGPVAPPPAAAGGLSEVSDAERAFALYEEDIVGKEQILVGERE